MVLTVMGCLSLRQGMVPTDVTAVMIYFRCQGTFNPRPRPIHIYPRFKVYSPHLLPPPSFLSFRSSLSLLSRVDSTVSPSSIYRGGFLFRSYVVARWC